MISTLLRRMTLRQKLRQMTMVLGDSLLKEGAFDAGRMEQLLCEGVGVLAFPTQLPSREEAVRVVREAQTYLLRHSAMHLPALVVHETLHGAMIPGATVFPQSIGLGSTWNPRLVGKMARQIAREARSCGIHQSLSPDLDLARDPRWGRVEETYGEDPLLVGELGLAYVQGMQGGSRPLGPQSLVCTVKHFAGHGSPEAGLNLGPVAGGQRDLRTLYLPPFRRAIVNGKALSVMPAYSEYEDVPASVNRLLLEQVLRREWKFDGYVFSDYGAIEMLCNFHCVAASPGEAGRRSLEAGMDLEAPSAFGFGDELLAMVQNGQVAEELLDRAVSRILHVKHAVGLLSDGRSALPAKASKLVCDRRLARQAARESIVLLKNQGDLLPIGKHVRSIAVIGPNADSAQLGDYTHFSARGVSPLQGLRTLAGRRVQVRYAKGCDLLGLDTAGIAEAVELARSSDLAVVVLGETSHSYGGVGWGTDKGQACCGEGFDRTELTPPGVQDQLLREVAATGTPVVLVLATGRPWAITRAAEHVPAIIQMWYAGQEGGHALAEILSGKVNPSGRLPISFPGSAGHVPAFYNHKPSARGRFYKRPGTPQSPGRDYVFSSPQPLFPFGHGLSYTRFRYSRLRLGARQIRPGELLSVQVDVQNIGPRAGQEVVQLYLRDMVSSVTTPVRALKRFTKVALRPGQRRTVKFRLGPEDMALLDEQLHWVVEPGEFEVTIGPMSCRFETRSAINAR